MRCIDVWCNLIPVWPIVSTPVIGVAIVSIIRVAEAKSTITTVTIIITGYIIRPQINNRR
jgi:hypothetical protein